MCSGDVLQLHQLHCIWHAALSLHMLPTEWQKRFHHRLMNHLHIDTTRMGLDLFYGSQGLELGAWDDV
jgi:hypothetical protein